MRLGVALSMVVLIAAAAARAEEPSPTPAPTSTPPSAATPGPTPLPSQAGPAPTATPGQAAPIATPIPAPSPTPRPTPKPRPPAKPRPGLVRVFFDCPGESCDTEYVETEVSFVDFLRDREDADVHVLVSTQPTGGGGTQYTVDFLGRRAFAEVNDSLVWIAPAGASREEVRKGLVHVLALGLARYAAHSRAAPDLDVAWDTANPEHLARGRDPWNAWTFRVSGHATLHGEKATSSRDFDYSAAATRVTPDWRISLSGYGTYSQSEFQLPGPPVTSYTSISRTYGIPLEVVKSLSPHFSTAASLTTSQSTYTNQALAIGGYLGAEYDVFPYSESTRRFLALRYWVGENYFRYFSETIFDRTSEYAPSEALFAILSTTQPWGDASFQLGGAHYLLKDVNGDLDATKYNVGGFATLSLRVAKGLSIDFYGSGSLLHDQLYLPKAGASDAEVLLQRRQLETSFQYYSSIGLSYTFGSIYSAVVNPRFR